MASTAGLVPITRPYLANYYERYPYKPVNDDLPAVTADLKEQIKRVVAERKKKGGGVGNSDPHMKVEPALKIDENLWMNREQMEETCYLFEEAHWPAGLKAQAASKSVQQVVETFNTLDKRIKALLVDIEKFQEANSTRITTIVFKYMPQDFRSSLIKQQRERTEKKRKAEVDRLVRDGGSIREKYALLWKQQMERRKQLAQLGSASGVYKQLVKLLVGVPVVLLEFVRTINDHNGPWEEQREHYGPPLYDITNLANSIRIFVSTWWSTFDSDAPSTNEFLTVLEKSVQAYVTDFEHYLSFMGEVFANSPFLITSEEAEDSNH